MVCKTSKLLFHVMSIGDRNLKDYYHLLAQTLLTPQVLEKRTTQHVNHIYNPTQFLSIIST